MPQGMNKPVGILSSGNVFADLGLRNAEEKQTKVRLAVAIKRNHSRPEIVTNGGGAPTESNSI
jgi:hypothetical protein